MLLVHQTGSVKVGEVVRYTLTYTPSRDRILPSPEKLHVRIRNTSAIAMRAAFVHGPYSLSVAAYPSTFDPNERFPDPASYGVPQFEPMLKAGGSWECTLAVPETVRQGAGLGSHGGFGKGPDYDHESVSWVLEVSSQVIFSASVAVGYELLVARDPKSLGLGGIAATLTPGPSAPASSSGGRPGEDDNAPGTLADHQQSMGAKDKHHPAQPRGIFSRAVHLTIEDTATLWNTPRLPEWDDEGPRRVKHRSNADTPVESVVKKTPEEKASEAAAAGPTVEGKDDKKDEPAVKPKKVHLVILTHGLHSNLGADMLFLKESIDAAAKQAKIDAKERRSRERAERRKASSPDSKDKANEGEDVGNNDTKQKEDNEQEESEDEDDDEEVIVRGYSGNATKTERGIKYLGKRLARYVLSMTYPDQPCLPVGKDLSHPTGHSGKHTSAPGQKHPTEAHGHGHGDGDGDGHSRPYKITSISFVAHSLGGLVQTYAVAYIQKHSPTFFDVIRPVNFIALATPFLGLSNENPTYVRFALDFGLVGRTGKDLGLTWRAPTLARSGWGAIVGNLGESAHRKVYGDTQPESKPLLRILPTGPAHRALKKFRNRTVYSNVVNDGIVPLRTSCLLFLDWHGLGRVDKARRDAGLVETMVGFGWAELTGTNLATARQRLQLTSVEQPQPSDSGSSTPKASNGSNANNGKSMTDVPQPSNDAVEEDGRTSIGSVPTSYNPGAAAGAGGSAQAAVGPGPGALAGFFNFFKSSEPQKSPPVTEKQKRILDKSQTLPLDDGSSSKSATGGTGTGTATTDTAVQPMASGPEQERRNKVTSGSEFEEEIGGLNAPPRTTFFESAGDVLNPKIPDADYLIDPSKRPRTIFHDRVYHPADIPPAPIKRRQSTFLRRKTFPRTNSQQSVSGASPSRKRDDSSTRAASDAGDEGTQKKTVNKDKDAAGPDNVQVDGSSMRVEEKIARDYHAGLSWRKVLVKLEPDAHNNIFVRRMFANAYGWPVVKHLVDAHFSDSAVARARTDDEYMGERALDMNQPPDEHGGETKPSISGPVSGGSPALSPATATRSFVKGHQHTDSESRDQVPSLPEHGPSSPPRRAESIDRSDAGTTWSERDWADSENDSDADAHAGEQGKQSSSSPASPKTAAGKEWNWTEKIVGKSAAKRRSLSKDEQRQGQTSAGSS